MSNATAASEHYKGFTIAVTPLRDCGDLWDFEYRITKAGAAALDGDPPAAITRGQSAGGHATPEVARLAGLQVARTEVDNLLALASRAPGSPQPQGETHHGPRPFHART